MKRHGLADEVLDISSQAAAWLFGDGKAPAPERLVETLGTCDTAVIYLSDSAGEVTARLQELGCKQVIVHPDRPPAKGDISLYEHLAEPVRSLFGGSVEGEGPLVPICIQAADIDRIRMRFGLGAEPYAVLHPGSGSAGKNWPPERYAALGQILAREMRVVVTSGEADADLGERVAGRIPEAVKMHSAALPDLAAVLAGAGLYVGNDSGVSHLASAVKACPETPVILVLFGPTRPGVWAPLGVQVLLAPDADLGALSVERVSCSCQRACQILRDRNLP